MFEIFIIDSPKQDGILTYMLYKAPSKEYAEMVAEELAENVNILFDYEDMDGIFCKRIRFRCRSLKRYRNN